MNILELISLFCQGISVKPFAAFMDKKRLSRITTANKSPRLKMVVGLSRNFKIGQFFYLHISQACPILTLIKGHMTYYRGQYVGISFGVN